MAKTQLVSIQYSPTAGVSGQKYFLASSTLYTSTNANDTGVTPAAATTKRGVTPLYDTGELMRAGYLDRINVYAQSGSGDQIKRVSYKMFCTPDKREALLNKLNGGSPGTVNGKQVTGASTGTRRQVSKV